MIKINKLWHIPTMDYYIIIKNCVAEESIMNEMGFLRCEDRYKTGHTI